MKEMKIKIKTFQNFRNNYVHQKYIEHIRFFMISSSEAKTRINFNFSITFFYGGNKDNTSKQIELCN
jgi:hypothetical protein